MEARRLRRELMVQLLKQWGLLLLGGKLGLESVEFLIGCALGLRSSGRVFQSAPLDLSLLSRNRRRLEIGTNLWQALIFEPSLLSEAGNGLAGPPIRLFRPSENKPKDHSKSSLSLPCSPAVSIAMRFTDSPVVELPVAATVLSFEQDNGSMHVGTSVWPCSLVLVKFVDRWLPRFSAAPESDPNPYSDLLRFPGKRAVELGSGCGPAGLGLFLLGLDIVLTDIAPVMPALRRNLKRNRHSLPRTPKHAQLYWNNLDQIRALRPPFDLVIAADVVYMEDSAVQLVSAMEKLVGENGVVLLGYQLRSPEAHQVFWQLCHRTFPVIEKVPHEDLHPDYAYEETDVYILRKRK